MSIRMISDLPIDSISASLILRNGKEVMVQGKVIKEKGKKYLIVEQSPKKSYGPGTRVRSWGKTEMIS